MARVGKNRRRSDDDFPIRERQRAPLCEQDRRTFSPILHPVHLIAQEHANIVSAQITRGLRGDNLQRATRKAAMQ